MTAPWITEADPQLPRLEEMLTAFYNDSTNKYPAFEADSRHDCYWSIVKESVQHKMATPAPAPANVRVLEFGAGRTQFGAFLKELRSCVTFVTQDITHCNTKHLQTVSDRIYIGDIADMKGEFDIIFSTFVWEHVTKPKQTLEALLALLAPSGSLFLFCPCYDVPGYVPPSLRHFGTFYGLWLSGRIFVNRLASLITGRPGFLVVANPAVFHGPWFRDSDAVHLVSRYDLYTYLRNRRVTLIDRWPRRENAKYTVLERFLKLCIEIRKDI
jgi:SAM-dependent methyltransferase